MKSSFGILSSSCLWIMALMRFAHVGAGSVHHDRSSSKNTQIVTGFFGSPSKTARIVVHNAAGQVSWDWSIDKAGNVPAALRQCAYDTCKAGGCAVPEVKWADNGRSVLSVYGYAAIIINHHPGLETDKRISFGVCTNRDDMDNSHTVELLPDGKVAVGTTTSAATGNIKIFNRFGPQNPLAAPIQQLHGIPGVHAVLWDARRSVLWAAGNDISPLSKASRSILNAYAYKNGLLSAKPQTWVIASATHLTTEWSSNTPWWDGAHAMVPIPGQDKLLITTDLDVHLYDMHTQKFEHGAPVAQKYLAGFQPLGKRVGPDGVSLPRSDIKSLSILDNGDTLYVQAVWGQTYGEKVNILADKKMQGSLWNQVLYRSRWFADTAW
ncbi:hypothetical protein ED733_001282 [Metarhizium rileyi]|uniref:WD40/YVTN repeat-like-containing domain protein n=1 Tax=Metarhizium rileyi (strain RCEF 4871) TaxID=1649241 RepID=A0A5C6FZM8_METRR|nr:hypothetical protein ED733_001282 [Metarhizium rileyi]